METQKDFTTLRKGREQFSYINHKGPIEYDYRTLQNIYFTGAFPNLAAARKARKKWMKTLKKDPCRAITTPEIVRLGCCNKAKNQ
jgi:hypothetical protein